MPNASRTDPDPDVPPDQPKPPSTIEHAVYEQPGHLFRRAQQISVSLFHEMLGSEITPIQYAILQMLQERPGVDQVTLARLTGLDNSTTATTAARLEAKGLLVREVVSTQRRQRSLHLSAQGVATLDSMRPGLHRLNTSLFDMLPPGETAELMRLLQKFVRLNNAQTRAPLRLDED
jgi:DNA-binding MarR family transcriptional regulator